MITLDDSIDTSSNITSSLKKDVSWPLSSQEAIEKFGCEFLTSFEQKEINQFDEIFYINRRERADEEFYRGSSLSNHGFDDENNYYRFKIGD